MHPAGKRQNQPSGLADWLRRLREAAGLTQERMAADLNWAPSKISKIENRNQLPAPGDIRAWAARCGHPDEAEGLLDLLYDAQAVRRQTRGRIRQGSASLEEDIDQRTRAASRIREFEVAAIPGLLQTAGYARAIAAQVAVVYGTADIDAAVRARMQRQQILYEGKEFEFVITEAALRMPPCPVPVMAGQLDRLLTLLDLENVTLAIIPMGTELSFAPFYGFLMLDDTVITEDYLGRNEGGAVAAETCSQIFALLLAQAVTGEDARQLIMAAAASLRKSDL